MRKLKARVFHIVQYINHPETNEALFSEDSIISALGHATIKQWAYILHDKDVYSEADEKDDPRHKQGEPKGPHYHIVLNCSNTAVEVSTIAKWFGVAENFVEVPRGNGCGKFLDCVEYLTHESYKQQELGKYRYPDEEVKSSLGFNWREKLDKRNENKAKYGKDLSEAEQLIYDITYKGLTLRQARTRNEIYYMNHFESLRKNRLEFIRQQPPPKTRINYYIQGKGGVGKDLMSRALARSLYPDIERDEDIFFIVGADNVTFEGYDGQPVIIWSDRRATQLLRVLKGKENFFNVFDTHPTNQRQNVKNSSVSLCNEVNIVNGQEDYIDFLETIVKVKDDNNNWVENEDKGQSYRRFPFINVLHDDYMEILINKGFFNNKRDEFSQFDLLKQVKGNIGDITRKCGGENKLQRVITEKVLKPEIDKHNEYVENENKEVNEEEVWKWIEENGIGEDYQGFTLKENESTPFDEQRSETLENRQSTLKICNGMLKP